MWKPDLCIYHGGCDDGFGAAWAIWRRWPACEFVPGYYGKPLPDAAGKHVLFVDFSAKRPALDAMAQTAASIVIIDHHKTAEADLAPFICGTSDGSLRSIPENLEGMFRDCAELNRPPVFAFFDMQSSGAVMAWDFAFGIEHNGSPPELLAYIQDRDLWRFAFGERTKQVSAALRTYPQDFQTWDRLATQVDDLISEGEIVLRAHRSNLSKILEEAYEDVIGGWRVPVVNAPYHYASDAAHELMQRHPDAPFAACWFRRADGQIQFSLRSSDDREDVSEIAKKFGGGGHRNAAGFQTPAE